MQSELAKYITLVNNLNEKTNRSDNRVLYGQYLASAGVILAISVSGAEKAELTRQIATHDRLLGTTYISQDDTELSDTAWQCVKACLDG